MNGHLLTPNGVQWGNWTTEPPPPSPTAPVPVTCDLPCVGKVYYTPQIPGNHPWWICGAEEIVTYRTEGRHGGGYYENWIPGQYTTTQTLAWHGFPPDVRWYFPPEPGGGSGFWSMGGIDPPSFGNNHVGNYVPTQGRYYRDSLGFSSTPCLTPEESYDLWMNHIHPAWSGSPEPERWVEQSYVTWHYAEIAERLPNVGSLVPLYAGTMGLLGGLLGGSAGGGFGAGGLASMSFVLALLQGVSSSSAAAGGRVLKSSEGEESFDGFW